MAQRFSMVMDALSGVPESVPSFGVTWQGDDIAFGKARRQRGACAQDSTAALPRVGAGFCITIGVCISQ